jgi:tetratricopeptide (TPR) repeat protein
MFGRIYIWETRADPQQQDRLAAKELVAGLIREFLLHDDVVARLRILPGMTPFRRQEALALAEGYAEDPRQLHFRARELVALPGRKVSDYQQALRYLERASRLKPPDAEFLLTTMGVVYYRLGNYPKALDLLQQSNSLLKKYAQAGFPANPAFLAMTHHQLGHAHEAQAALEKLRRVMKIPGWAQDREAQSFLREAEALLTKPPAPGKKENH